jgi:hypothetical protein
VLEADPDLDPHAAGLDHDEEEHAVVRVPVPDRPEIEEPGREGLGAAPVGALDHGDEHLGAGLPAEVGDRLLDVGPVDLVDLAERVGDGSAKGGPAGIRDLLRGFGVSGDGP